LALQYIPVLPKGAVIAHKQKELRRQQKSYGRALGAVLGFAFRAFGILSLLGPLKAWERERTETFGVVATFAYGMALLVATLAGFYGAMLGSPWFCLGFLPGFGFAGRNALQDFIERSPIGLAFAEWSRVRVVAGKNWFRAPDSLLIPDHVHARAARAQGLIPGARLYVEYLTQDPFLAVVTGFGPWEEKEYIAAWGTGDKKLDSF